MQKYGGAMAIVPATDTCSALERGVIDGAVHPIQNEMQWQLYQVCKDLVEPPFYQSSVVFIVNSNVWNKLPKEQQTIMITAGRESIKEFMDDIQKETANARQIAQDKGMKFISFSGPDKDWFLSNLYETAWEDNTKRFPDVAAKLRPMISK